MKVEKLKLPLGIKLIIGYHLLNIVLWTIGQGGAVVAYDAVVEMGLQDARELLNLLDQLIAFFTCQKLR